MRPRGKESTEVWITEKIGKERGNSNQRNGEITEKSTHKHIEV